MSKDKDAYEDSSEAAVDVIESIKLFLIRSGLIREQPNLRGARASEKLEDIASKSHDILFKAKTVFPFTLFPDTVVLDREKITIANRYFFFVEKITGTPIRDILSVEADIGPFFGSIHMSSRFFITNPYTINFLHRRDAIRLRRLLQGYIIAFEQNIDCTGIVKKDLVGLLDELGRGDTD